MKVIFLNCAIQGAAFDLFKTLKYFYQENSDRIHGPWLIYMGHNLICVAKFFNVIEFYYNEYA